MEVFPKLKIKANSVISQIKKEKNTRVQYENFKIVRKSKSSCMKKMRKSVSKPYYVSQETTILKSISVGPY